MGSLARKAGPGRPRELGKGDDERATNAVVRLADSHRAELDALIGDGKAANRSEAMRSLIEESAKRRARQHHRL